MKLIDCADMEELEACMEAEEVLTRFCDDARATILRIDVKT